MYRNVGITLGLALILALTLSRGGSAQQPPAPPHGGGPASHEPPTAPAQRSQEPASMRAHMRGMREHGGMRGQGRMIQQHFERMAQHLGLSEAQRAQAQSLIRNHAKEIIHLQADIDTLALDLQSLLETEPADLAQVKQVLQSTAAKEADLRLAHITAMQEVHKLLTPEQQQKFRLMQRHMMTGEGGSREHEGGQEHESGREREGGRSRVPRGH